MKSQTAKITPTSQLAQPSPNNGCLGIPKGSIGMVIFHLFSELRGTAFSNYEQIQQCFLDYCVLTHEVNNNVQFSYVFQRSEKFFKKSLSRVVMRVYLSG